MKLSVQLQNSSFQHKKKKQNKTKPNHTHTKFRLWSQVCNLRTTHSFILNRDKPSIWPSLYWVTLISIAVFVEVFSNFCENNFAKLKDYSTQIIVDLELKTKWKVVELFADILLMWLGQSHLHQPTQFQLPRTLFKCWCLHILRYHISEPIYLLQQ